MLSVPTSTTVRSALFLLATTLAAIACSSESTTTPAAASSSGAPSTPTDGTSTPGDGTTNTGGAKAGPGAAFKTYVILGDSISDRGGSGPFFYDLLADDLKGKLPDIKVVKQSKGGAVSADLVKQAKALPKDLAGPVAITITIGGNDMQSAALQILNGTDDKERTAFGDNLKKSFDELTAPDRFGAGVKATIFQATIYDPTDGEGNFAEAGCPGYLSAIPKQPTKGFWDNWNKTAADIIATYGESIVTVDIRTLFQGHGVGHFKDGSSWFAPDCIHPNTAGHLELSKIFFKTIEP